MSYIAYATAVLGVSWNKASLTWALHFRLVEFNSIPGGTPLHKPYTCRCLCSVGFPYRRSGLKLGIDVDILV